MKKFTYTIIIFFLLSFRLAIAQGGGCGCTNCPQFMPDNFTGDFLINVVGATNNDLSDPSQGICEVKLNFDHQYIGDLSITLTSPSGQVITLVGPIGLFGESDLSTWDVSFLPCASTPVPDLGFGTWQNNELTRQSYDFVGSYHPNVGCLEDFNTGPINGTWTLTVTDGQAIDVGTFIDYEIIFCDDDGINCNSNPCGVFAEAEAPSFACQGDTIVIDASGSTGNTFQWGTQDGTFVGNPTGPFVQVIESGTYTVTVSDNGSCPEVATVIFNTVPEVPTAEITVSNPLDCNNTEVTLQGATDITEDLFVNWVAGSMVDPDNFQPLGMDLDLVVDEPGTYTIVVINTESACSQTATITIEDESVLPVIEAEVVDTITCQVDNVDLSASADIDGSTYAWTGPNDFSSPDDSPTVMEPGVYNLTVTTPNGCIDSTTLLVEADTIPPTISVSAANAIDCTVTATDLNFNTTDDITSLSWTGPNGYTNDIDQSPSVNLGGTYVLTVTIENGCTAQDSVEVIQNAEFPDITTVDDGIISCTNQTYSLSGGSSDDNVTFAWTGPNGFSVATADAGMVSDTGLYTLTVFSDNGCSISNQVFIDADTTRPMASIDPPAILDCNNNMTTLTLNSTDNIVSYDWTGPNAQSSDEANPEIEGPGIYEVNITGQNGCTNTLSIEVVSDDTRPTTDLSVMQDDEINCIQTEVTIINNNTDPNYTYQWSGPNGYTSSSDAPTIENGGEYLVTVTGTNGCTETTSITIIEDTDEPDIETTTAEIDCNNEIVSIGVTSTANIINYDWRGEGGYTSSEQNPDDITSSGDYLIVITAENGCTNSSVLEVTENTFTPDGQILFADGFDFTCNLTSLSLLGSSSNPNDTFQWEDPMGNIINASDIEATMVGTYNLIVTAPNGCTIVLDAELDEDLSGPEVTSNPNVDLFCNGGAILNVEANENITAYSWTGPNGFTSNNPNPEADQDGVYEVIITGETGCTTSTTVEVIDQRIPPSIFVDPTQTLLCGQDQLTLNGGSNDNDVELSWATVGGNIISGNIGTTIDVNTQGTYILTVTNTNTGCEASAEVLVDQDNNTPIADISVVDMTINCNRPNITLDAMGSDNGSGFDFDWGNNGGTDLSGTTSLQPMITEAGTYFITVTNTNNQCTSIASVEIDSDLEEPNIELSQIGRLDCNITSLNIENIAINSAANLNYEWQANSGGNINSGTDLSQIDIDAPGEYSLLLANEDNGCTSDITFLVEQDIDEPQISAGNNLSLDCGVDVLQLAGSISSLENDITIMWSTTSGTILNGENTFTPDVSAAANYTLTVTNNDNGCSSTSEVIVEPNLDAPTIAFEPAADFNCGTSSLVLEANVLANGQNLIYEWSNAEGLNIFDDDTPNPEIFAPGTYTLLVTDIDNNCTVEQSITIEPDTLAPSLVLSQADELSCIVEEVNLGVSSNVSGLSLQWNVITGNLVSGENTPNPIVNQAGEYELVITDTNNQCTNSATVIVNLDENTPVVAISPSNQLTCDVQELILDASNSSQGSNIEIAWETDAGNFVSGEDGLSPLVNMPGNYTLTITDTNNGCEVSQSIEIMQNIDSPEVEIDMPDMLDCNNTSIAIQALNQGASNYTYSWSTTDGNIVDGQNSLSPNFDEVGTYTLLATDTDNGCTDAFEITIFENIIQPDINIGSNYQITCIEETIVIDGLGSSMGSEFTYSWSDENGIEISDQLAIDLNTGGTYSLSILNNENGCSQMASINIDDIRLLPEVEILEPENITCQNPSIQLIANELLGQDLEYTWEDDQGVALTTDPTANTISVDLEGVYTLNVVDPSNGCTASYSTVVSADQTSPVFTLSAINNGVLDCQNPSITLSGELSGLTAGGVSVNWSTIDGFFVSDEDNLALEVVAPGTYQLEVTNLSNGCSNTQEIVVTADDSLPLASLNQPGDLNCDVASLTLSTPLDGDNLEVTWSLDGQVLAEENSNELNINVPGEYLVVITNLDNGCSSMDQITISQDIAAPIINAGEDFELQCNIPEIQLSGSVDGNVNFELTWNVGNGGITQGLETLTPTVNQAGTYTLEVRNVDNGCISTDVVNITVNENIPVDLTAEVQQPQCEDDLGSISSLNVIGGEGPYLFSLDGGISFSEDIQFDQLTSGDYQIEAIDANECPISTSFEILEPLDIAVDLEPEIEILLGDSATLTTNLSNINLDDIQSIQWTPSAGLSCDDCLSPSTSTISDVVYTVEIILSSGCSVVDNIQLRVDRDFSIYLPNAFSPHNLDGINDSFFLFAKENVVTNINSFSIFDRWGNQLFFRENIQPNDSSLGWDGEFRNEEMPIGIYIYSIEVEFRNGSTELVKGDFLLSR